jgi:hypothetical protein
MSALNRPQMTRGRRMRAARREGVASGVWSVLVAPAPARPAPPLVRRGLGSLTEDGRAISRDGERLFDGDRT